MQLITSIVKKGFALDDYHIVVVLCFQLKCHFVSQF